MWQWGQTINSSSNQQTKAHKKKEQHAPITRFIYKSPCIVFLWKSLLTNGKVAPFWGKNKSSMLISPDFRKSNTLKSYRTKPNHTPEREIAKKAMRVTNPFQIPTNMSTINIRMWLIKQSLAKQLTYMCHNWLFTLSSL